MIKKLRYDKRIKSFVSIQEFYGVEQSEYVSEEELLELQMQIKNVLKEQRAYLKQKKN